MLFENIFSQEKIHICILSETWLDSNCSSKINSYMYRQDRDDSYGGIAIVIHKSIKAQCNNIILPNPYIQALHIKIFNCCYLENVIAIHCPPNVSTSSRDWKVLFSKWSSKTIVAGDFNGHHSNWSTKNNSRGIQIYDASIEYNYVSLNNEDSTRIKYVLDNCQKSSPDISFATSDIALRFDWTILNESLGSDHLMVCMSADMALYTGNHFIKRNFKQADWQKYKRILQ